MVRRKTDPDILIIGYGTVGHNLSKELEPLHPDWVDKYKEGSTKRPYIMYDLAFVCVDTPRTEDEACDMHEVENAILENSAQIFVIKSTVLPGTTERLSKKTGKCVIFSPEYYGGTQHCNNFNFDFTILGGEKDECECAAQLLQRAYDGRHTFRFTDSTTAEMAKYMENAWLATKVSFCNQFADIAEQAGVSYEELRELFILDPRVNPSHTHVYWDSPYWDSHCLNKDVPAIAEAFRAPFLDGVIMFNEHCKAVHAMEYPDLYIMDEEQDREVEKGQDQ